MIRIDAATVLLQWAVGGMAFCWVTTRRREVGIGYGWLLRVTYLVFAAGSVAASQFIGTVLVRDVASVLVVVSTMVGLVVSIVRRRAGVAGEHERQEERSARVTEMTGIDREAKARDLKVVEFPPVLDLIPVLIGVVGLFAAGIDATGDGSTWVSLMRIFAGGAFLGAVTDAMLLGHWYLVQPGLPRAPLLELVRWLAIIWPFEVVALLLPTGMLSVLSGTIDDGYNGTLGWYWVASAIGTIILCAVTRAALRERYYSAVMAATGLLYLAILTAFSTDLVARALLAG